MTSTHSKADPSRTASIRPLVHAAIWLGSLPILAVILAHRGADFYLLDVQSRVDHPDFRVLSPSGPVGHGYGIVGTALLLTNLTYLLRRRFARMRAGSMRTWLDLHVFSGIFGSLLVMFHSSFQVRTGIAALTSGSLTLVVLSGLIGRYFYALSPSPAPQQLDRSLQRIAGLHPALGHDLRRTLPRLPAPPIPEGPGLWPALRLLPASQRGAWIRKRLLLAVAKPHLETIQRPDLRKQLFRELKGVQRHVAAEVRSVAGGPLLRSWRGVHRFTALLMVLSVVVHIVVALYFGFHGLTTR